MIFSPEGTHRGEDTTLIASHAAPPPWFVPSALALALAAYALLAFGYVRLTPIWQNPDEPAHFNYVAFVAQTGGLPVLQPGDWDSELLERLKNGTLFPTDSVSSIRYESWQPPLFYLLAVPVFRFGPDGDAAVLRLRALNAVIGGATLIVAYFVARVALPPDLASLVPGAIVGIPMFTAVSASVSADPLANLLAAAILLTLLTRQHPILVGGLTGLGILTKLELAIFVPLLIGVIATRSPRPGRDLAQALGAAAVVMLPWLVHQVTSYGWTDPLAIARHSSVVADQPRFPGLTLDWLVDFLTVSFHSFWAQFGWMAVIAPDRLYLFWGIVSLAAVIGLVLVRACLTKQPWPIFLATLAIAAIAYVGYNVAFVQFQGRYVFTALAPIACLLVRGWAGVLPTRSQPWSVLAVVAALVAVNAYTLLRVLVPGFAPAG